MRRCIKYIKSCSYQNWKLTPKGFFIANDCNCNLKKLCEDYTPVEIDPYWKDIIDETNRRLYDR